MKIRILVMSIGLVALVAASCSTSEPDLSIESLSEPAQEPEASAETEPVAVPTLPPEPEPEATAPAATAGVPTPNPTATPAPTPQLELSLQNFPALGDSGEYEVWLGDGSITLSIGTFDDGTVPQTLPLSELAFAPTEVLVTIETDDDPAPSDSVVLQGAIVDGTAALTTAPVGDFSSAIGQYILATPTDGTGTPENERSGVWWTVIPRAQSLFVPELPAGWIYEGWQVIDGQAVTTGTFRSPFGSADDAAPFSGPQPGPPLVGEDFLLNAPAGLTFPYDLRGTELFISVEPFPDTGPEPFTIVPLIAVVPIDAVDHTAYPANPATNSLPIGLATITS